MTVKFFQKYSLLVLIFCGAAIFVNAQRLTGIVKTSDGKPIEKAWIRPGFVNETDKDGKFVIEKFSEKFLIITKESFRPLIKKLNGETEVEIVLERESENGRLMISECTKKSGGKIVGANLKISVPKGFNSKKGNDVDYSAFTLFPKNDQKYVLFGISGGNASSGFPRDEWINSTDKLNIRTVTNGKREIGFDYYGQTNDGKYWRYLQIVDEYISFMVDTTERKDVFDKIIESACINPESL
jgi:hypothetical protein